MNDSFIFTGGKHNGKTYGLVKKIEPGYISWCEDNAPNMLKEKKKPKPPEQAGPAPRREPPPDSEVVESSLKNNINFLNEGPHGKLE